MSEEQAVVRLAKPETGEEELALIAEVLQSGYLTQGPKVAQFETLIAEYVGTRYAFAMSSGTTALHLSLVALGVGPSDEVLVADYTFPATGNVVVQQGAKPVLVDIDLDTYTIDIDDLARKLTPKTKAIIPVHTFGLSADMNGITRIAVAHDIAVIEDAACAIGTHYYGKPCGSLSTMGCFSFHPRKVITTGEGGMITTDDERLAEQIGLLRSHGGIRRDGRFTFEAAGFNYRLSDVQGAIGVAQMARLDTLVAQKRELASRYHEHLSLMTGVHVPKEPKWGGHIYQSYVVRLDDAIDRDHVIEAMREQGIETTLGTYALHAEPYYQQQFGYKAGDLPNSYRAYKQCLTLPLHTYMDENDVARVVSALSHSIKVPKQPQVE